MNSLARSIVGAAVAAAAVYFMDPANGHQRRLLLQDGCRRAARRVEWSTRNLRRDASGPSHYFGARAGAVPKPASDRKVSKHVCGAVRHAVSHPEDVSVAVDHGHVILRGKLQPHEHQRVLDEVRRQPGVILITDHLSERRGNGEYSLVDNGHSFKSAAGRSGWSTTGRVLAGCAGGALLYFGVRERKTLGEIATAIAEEVRHVMERNLQEGFDAAKDTVAAAEEGLAGTARTAAKKVDEGMEWAEAKSSDVMEEYAQKRGRQPDIAGTAH
ncbi:MAG TPA: hypothetical protein VGE08_00865 [Steroidobacter sp.]|uniref:hypothetical protein n=1 Tax=Steroidobacter sp. TaxID=1978227 RepID=UPI002ED9D549